MGDNLTKEYFLKLIDGASVSLSGDALMEEHEEYDYTITPSTDAVVKESDEISSCHRCQACFSRRVYAEPMLRKNPLILFVLPYPEGDMMLSSESFSYFSKWLKAIGLSLDDVALSALIKCPVEKFSSSDADSCRDYLRNEMKTLSPSSIVLLGKDTASYMLKKTLDFDALRLHTYKINGIRTFTTYTPLELVRDRFLRVKIWEDLKYISNALNRGERL